MKNGANANFIRTAQATLKFEQAFREQQAGNGWEGWEDGLFTVY